MTSIVCSFRSALYTDLSTRASKWVSSNFLVEIKQFLIAVFSAPCRSCVNRRFGGTSVHTRSTQRHIPEDGILHSHLHENLKSYTVPDCFSFRNKTCSKTHSKEEHNAPTPTHKHIEGTCIYVNNRREQFPHQKDFNTWWWPYWPKHVVNFQAFKVNKFCGTWCCK
jgi:hypothetical protein